MATITCDICNVKLDRQPGHVDYLALCSNGHSTLVRVKEKRHTTVHSRFHVGCSLCGFVEATQRGALAHARAESHLFNHRLDGAKVTVFDSMHAQGKPGLWVFDADSRRWAPCYD